MKENLFTIPKTITAGYQGRKDTYSGRLAYIIYTDDKGVLRKEKSWNSWRDKQIPTTINDNIPHSGFFINKPVGGYVNHWMRQSYIRMYDSVFDLEFEITLPNLNYILNNCSWNPENGLDGDFIYAWYGTDLWVLPACSKAYKDSTELLEQVRKSKKFKEKDLVVGNAYKFKNNAVLVYVGKLTKVRTLTKTPYVEIYNKHIFTSNDSPFGYFTAAPIKNIIECTGTYTITNPEVLKALQSDFNYTGIAYMTSTPSLIKKHFNEGAYTFYTRYDLRTPCDVKMLDNMYRAAGAVTLQTLANRLYVKAEFKDGKLVHILT